MNKHIMIDQKRRNRRYNDINNRKVLILIVGILLIAGFLISEVVG